MSNPLLNIAALTKTVEVLREVGFERSLQDRSWGEQNHPDIGGTTDSIEDLRDGYVYKAGACKSINSMRLRRRSVGWDGILLEEVWEALAESDPAKLREELIQVAAVAVCWIEAIDRRGNDRQ